MSLPIITDFRAEEIDDLVVMWRSSFEHGVGIKDPNPIEDQVAFFFREVQPKNRVRVAKKNDKIVGFLASTPASITQLFVHVDHLGQGIGGQLLRLAQTESSGSLWLYTFRQNTRACGFYEHHGFEAIEYGFEPVWQLEDVKYNWCSQPGAA